MTRALLVVAHGSRRDTSNEEVRKLTSRLSTKCGKKFDLVDCAFLELAEPSIPEGLERCINQGAKEVIVFPYFLAAGRHVVTDIPGEIAAVTSRHPNIDIRLVPHLGQSAQLVDAILGLATSDPA